MLVSLVNNQNVVNMCIDASLKYQRNLWLKTFVLLVYLVCFHLNFPMDLSSMYQVDKNDWMNCWLDGFEISIIMEQVRKKKNTGQLFISWCISRASVHWQYSEWFSWILKNTIFLCRGCYSTEITVKGGGRGEYRY